MIRILLAAFVCVIGACSEPEPPGPVPARFDVEKAMRDHYGVAPDAPNAWDAIDLAAGQLKALEATAGERDPQNPIPYYDLVESTPDNPVTDENRSNHLIALDVVSALSGSSVDAELERLANAVFACDPLIGSPEALATPTTTSASARSLARACAARIRHASARGNWEEFDRSVRHLAALARHLSNQPSNIHNLVGMAIEALLADTLHRYVHLMPLESLIATQDQIERPTIATATVIRAEMQGLAEFLGRGLRTQAKGTTLATRDATLRITVHELAETFAALAARPRRERESSLEFAEVTARIPTLAKERREELKASATQAELIPRLLRSLEQREVNRRGIVAHLAIEAYKRTHGRYPESLAALDNAAVSGPEPVSSEPLVYRLSDDGASFTLYAIGHDAKDDGGAAHPTSAPLALLEEGAGYDYVIVPRP